VGEASGSSVGPLFAGGRVRVEVVDIDSEPVCVEVDGDDTGEVVSLDSTVLADCKYN
jgi:hypothetical protein